MKDFLGRVYCGDMRSVLRQIPTDSIDLAYLDPPFGTQRDFGQWMDRSPDDSAAQEHLEAWPKDARALFGHVVKAFVLPNFATAYMAQLGAQLMDVRRVVRDTGSIWIHVDERFAHVIRLFAELILQPAEWRRTVIWRYRRWPAKSRGFQRMHDVLFWFAGPGSTFHELYGYEPIAESTRKTFGTSKQRASFDDAGNRISVRTTEVTKGPPLSDVWELPILPPSGLERRRGGTWPTQKPETLLERVILSTSNQGDVVLDPCCGSGTTLAVAQKFGRKWIGIDASPEACKIATARLDALNQADSELQT